MVANAVMMVVVNVVNVVYVGEGVGVVWVVVVCFVIRDELEEVSVSCEIQSMVQRLKKCQSWYYLQGKYVTLRVYESTKWYLPHLETLISPGLECVW